MVIQFNTLKQGGRNPTFEEFKNILDTTFREYASNLSKGPTGKSTTPPGMGETGLILTMSVITLGLGVLN